MLRLWGAHNRVIGRSRTGELALFCSSLQILISQFTGLGDVKPQLGTTTLCP